MNIILATMENWIKIIKGKKLLDFIFSCVLWSVMISFWIQTKDGRRGYERRSLLLILLPLFLLFPLFLLLFLLHYGFVVNFLPQFRPKREIWRDKGSWRKKKRKKAEKKGRGGEKERKGGWIGEKEKMERTEGNRNSNRMTERAKWLDNAKMGSS